MKIIDERKDPRTVIHVRIDRDLHQAMKDIAERDRRYLGAVYEEAVVQFLQGRNDESA